MFSYGLVTSLPPLVAYPCRQPNGSLYPDYRSRCPTCPFRDTPNCIMASTPLEEDGPKKSEARQRAAERRAAKLRGQGLNAVGKPLARTCWNCENIRHVLDSDRPVGYVCRFDPDRPTQTAASMQNTSACGARFKLRTYMDILILSRKPQEEEHAIPELG